MRLLIAPFLLWAAGAYALPTLLVDLPTGQITGADGVSVNGMLYNVRLLQGTFEEAVGPLGFDEDTGVFTPPPEQWMSVYGFPASNYEESVFFSFALWEQVVVGAYAAGFEASNIRGCFDNSGQDFGCLILTQYAFCNCEGVEVASSNYTHPVFVPDISVEDLLSGANDEIWTLNLDVSLGPVGAWAVWSHAQVPEPPAIALMVLGLALFGWRASRSSKP